jgi:hypothetical protein
MPEILYAVLLSQREKALLVFTEDVLFSMRREIKRVG